MMTRIILGLSLFLFLSTQVIAQGPPMKGKRQKIEAMKIGYMTTELNLSEEESMAFWPIYNEFKQEERNLRKSLRPVKPISEMSEEEAKSTIEKQLEGEAALVVLKRKYFDRFNGVISMKKIAMIPRLEKSFKEKVLKEMRSSRGGKK